MSTGTAADTTATAKAPAPAPAPAQTSSSPPAPSSSSTLGPLIRLWGIQTAQLPSPGASAEELQPFLAALLREAVPFIDAVAPKAGGPGLWKHKADKSSADSEAPVEVYERVISGGELEKIMLQQHGENDSGGGDHAADNNNNNNKKKKKKRPDDETWMCRRSVHADEARPGTAAWAEFARCFRDEHAEAEQAFTPNVAAAYAAHAWNAGTAPLAGVAPVEVSVAGVGEEAWTNFRLRVQEMRHRIGAPLKDRTFVVLQMVAERAAAAAAAAAQGGGADKEFVVVSVPVMDYGIVAADKSRLAAEKGAHVARYVSVERVRKIPGGPAAAPAADAGLERQKTGGAEAGAGDAGKIEWLMATASDAGGVLPMWVQNMAMPSVVWKDVPLFLKWIAEERQKRDIAKDGVKGEVVEAKATETTAKDAKATEAKGKEAAVKAVSNEAAKSEAKAAETKATSTKEKGKEKETKAAEPKTTEAKVPETKDKGKEPETKEKGKEPETKEMEARGKEATAKAASGEAAKTEIKASPAAKELETFKAPEVSTGDAPSTANAAADKMPAEQKATESKPAETMTGAQTAKDSKETEEAAAPKETSTPKEAATPKESTAAPEVKTGIDAGAATKEPTPAATKETVSTA